MKGVSMFFQNGYVMLSITTFVFTNLLLLAHRTNTISPFKTLSKRVKFSGFLDPNVEWILLNNTVTVIVPSYVNEITLTPAFDQEVLWEIQDLSNHFTNFCEVLHNHGQISLVIQTFLFFRQSVRLQNFSFVSDQLRFPLHLIFEPLSSLDLSEWTGWELGGGDVIGGGGYGYLYKVVHKKTKLEAALKVREYGSYRKGRCMAEIDALTKLRGSPNIPQIYGWAKHPNRDRKGSKYGDREEVFILMELLDGDVYHLLRSIRKQYQKGKVTFSRKQKAATKAWEYEIVANSTRALVQGLIDLRSINVGHLDIKTTNVIYKKISERQFDFRLNDFGTAREYKYPNGSWIRRNSHVGTKGYQAPEKRFDARADIYSVGCYTFSHLANRYAWQGPKDYMPNEKLTSDSLRTRTHEVGDLERCKYCWKGVTMNKVAKDFINKMCKYVPDERPTLDQALKHPFLKL